MTVSLADGSSLIEQMLRLAGEADAGDGDLLGQTPPTIHDLLHKAGDGFEQLLGDESRSIMAGWRDGTIGKLHVGMA
ncbi:MAG TPA: hypothetical protein VMV92_35145 [Streptosporangiaceae bacterium]|nr:hypothetical protein [Streptosporangiaceae bacterium]